MFFEILIDHGETKNKCTIAPQTTREDFRISRARGQRSITPFISEILLHHEGLSLASLNRNEKETYGIACIDCVWRRLPILMRKIPSPLPQLVSIPSSFVTAYPRRSKNTGDDPTGGLATIEALFIAASFLGKWDETLLSKYYFSDLFLEMNKLTFESFGIYRPKILDSQQKPEVDRNALQRRIDRGRAGVKI